ncbi:MAG: hypothetical protein ACRDE2_06630 [Chitinophagaceae bacterium]
MKKLLSLSYYFLLATLLLTSCNKKDKSDPSKSGETAGHIAGMGYSRGKLEGTSFALPASVELKGDIQGNQFLLNISDRTDYCKKTGSGKFVSLKINLVNHSDKDTTFLFPAGLCFVAKDTADQHGILLQEVKIALLKGEVCKAHLYAYCLNEHKAGSHSLSRYAFGPVSNSRLLNELISLLKNKQIDYSLISDYDEYLNMVFLIQHVLWNITDGKGLTDENRMEMKNLPDM